MEKRRTHPVRADKIEDLRLARGISPGRLAEIADLSPRQLTRILNGGEAFLSTISRLADALRTTPDALRADIKPETTTFVDLNLSFKGVLADDAQVGLLVTITPKIMELLKTYGIKISSHGSSMSITEYAGEELRRSISLVFGVLASGSPFWAFLAVKVSMYGQFVEAQRMKTLDLDNFSSWGEIVYCGEGLSPDDETIRKVAAMYQTDPAKLIAFAQRLGLESPET